MTLENETGEQSACPECGSPAHAGHTTGCSQAHLMKDDSSDTEVSEAAPPEMGIAGEAMEHYHEQWHTSEADIRRIVQHRMEDVEVQSVKKIVGGYDNEVWEIEAAGKNLIMRINRGTNVPFALEQKAIEQYRAAGVPVATILYSGRDEIELESGKSFEVMIQEKADGTPLNTLKEGEGNLDFERMNAIMEDVGRVLKKMHSVKAEGFGQRNIDGSWEYKTWQEYMDAYIEARRNEKESIMKAGFSDKEFDDIIRLLEKYQYPCEQPVLCHDDYVARHIFIDPATQKVTCVIDMGGVIGAPPPAGYSRLVRSIF